MYIQIMQCCRTYSLKNFFFPKIPKKILILFCVLFVETQVMPMMITVMFSLLYEEYQR